MADPLLARQTTGALLDKTSSGLDLDRSDLALLEVLAKMQDAPEIEPPDRVVVSGDGEKVAPMVRTKTVSAGYVYLRRMTDGKLKEINKNQLVERLRQTLPDGAPAWLPPNAPWAGRELVGTVLCLLNSKHHNRGQMDELALPYCAKQGTFANDYAMRRHVRLKHREAWAAIQRSEDQRREDRRDQRDQQVADAIRFAVEGKAPPVEAVVEAGQSFSVECPECHETFEAGGKLAASNKLKAHIRKAHGKE